MTQRAKFQALMIVVDMHPLVLTDSCVGRGTATPGYPTILLGPPHRLKNISDITGVQIS
jgi:hypothetical protein